MAEMEFTFFRTKWIEGVITDNEYAYLVSSLDSELA